MIYTKNLNHNMWKRSIIMAIKMLVFDVRECERKILENKNIENFDITLYSECLNDETIKNIPQSELESTMVVSVFLDSEVTENVINAFKNLRIISTRSSDTEHINKKAAYNKNIDIVNVEGYSTKTGAQFTIMLMIALVRNLIPLSKSIESNNIVDFTGYDISKLTLGVIGTGATGAEVCKIAQAIGMKILAYDIVEKQELINKTDAVYVDFETILKESDILTIHLPYAFESKNLITKKELNLMKNTAYIINTSKADIVNIKDLYNALKEKKIQGAGLDIRACKFANPNCAKLGDNLNTGLECYEETKIISELAKMSNVIVTPHVGYKTEDVLEYILDMNIRGILDCIKGGSQFKC